MVIIYRPLWNPLWIISMKVQSQDCTMFIKFHQKHLKVQQCSAQFDLPLKSHDNSKSATKNKKNVPDYTRKR